MKIQSSGASPNKNGDKIHKDTSKGRSGGESTITRRQFLTRGAAAVIGAGLLTSGYAWQGSRTGLRSLSWTCALRSFLPLFQG